MSQEQVPEAEVEALKFDSRWESKPEGCPAEVFYHNKALAAALRSARQELAVVGQELERSKSCDEKHLTYAKEQVSLRESAEARLAERVAIQDDMDRRYAAMDKELAEALRQLENQRHVSDLLGECEFLRCTSRLLDESEAQFAALTKERDEWKDEVEHRRDKCKENAALTALLSKAREALDRGLRKMQTYVSIYPDDKELRALLVLWKDALPPESAPSPKPEAWPCYGCTDKSCPKCGPYLANPEAGEFSGIVSFAKGLKMRIFLNAFDRMKAWQIKLQDQTGQSSKSCFGKPSRGGSLILVKPSAFSCWC